MEVSELETDLQKCIVLLIRQDGALTLNEISNRLNKPKIHLYPSLKSLSRGNIIYKPKVSNKYHLTDFRQG